MRSGNRLRDMVLALMPLAALACNDPVVEKFRVATFNAGLAPLDVDYAEARLQPVCHQLASAEVDLLCVQEFWRPADWDMLLLDTYASLPHRVRKYSVPVKTTCEPAELQPVVSCSETNCPGLSGLDLGGCALSACGDFINGLKPACADCMLGEAQAGSDLDDIRTSCLGTRESRSSSYLYEGSFDTGILTSADIIERDTLVLDSYLVRAAVNYARLDTRVGELDVYCTHLASEISTFEYRGLYGSWEGEQKHQMEQLVAFIAEKSDPDDQVLVLGDLNTGPGKTAAKIAPKWISHYEMLSAEGFSNPYAASTRADCTVCPENTLNEPDQEKAIIDHVLVRGVQRVSSPSRFFTKAATVRVNGALNMSMNLSDHYGVALTLERDLPFEEGIVDSVVPDSLQD